MSKYYIAYGSNMNIKDMKKRCPAAQFVRTWELYTYMLMFSTYATIMKSTESSVPAVVWAIGDEDEKILIYMKVI